MTHYEIRRKFPGSEYHDSVLVDSPNVWEGRGSSRTKQFTTASGARNYIRRHGLSRVKVVKVKER